MLHTRFFTTKTPNDVSVRIKLNLISQVYLYWMIGIRAHFAAAFTLPASRGI
jgi:hypothetical protein